MREQEEIEIPDSVTWDWNISIWEVSRICGNHDNIIKEDTAEMIHLPYSDTSVTIEYGCLNEIVKYLTLELGITIIFVTNFCQDFNLLECFIVTYKKFAPPRVILAKLQERFYVPNTVSDNDRIVIQSRVANFISHWLDLAPTDWDGGKLFSRINLTMF